MKVKMFGLFFGVLFLFFFFKEKKLVCRRAHTLQLRGFGGGMV